MPGRPFEKGRSGNPGGRPKLEKQIRDFVGRKRVKLTDGTEVDGWEALAGWLFDIANPENKAPNRDRVLATKELYDRGYGKPKQHVDLGGDLNVGPPIDMSKLTKDQLLALAQLPVGVDTGEGDGTTEH
jgi:hypothetical protein